MSVLFLAVVGMAQASMIITPVGDLVRTYSPDSLRPVVRWSFDEHHTVSVNLTDTGYSNLLSPVDTVQGQEIFEYSDAYYTRLDIHRKASYAMLPLFLLQYIAGEQLLTKGRFAPGWAKTAHAPLAYAVGGLFVVNTVTGAWNLAESARDPNGRTRRTLHALMMFAADVGFVFTGLLAPSTNSIEQRLAVGDTSWTPHKYVAVSAMGIAAASWLLMVLWNG